MSVIVDDFTAQTFQLTNRKQVDHLLVKASNFSVDQSWSKFAKLASQMVIDGFHGQDF